MHLVSRTERFLHRARERAHDLEIRAHVRHVPDVPVVLFRDDERMSGRLRADVEEGEECVVLVHPVRRYVTRDYLAENTILHANEYTRVQ